MTDAFAEDLPSAEEVVSRDGYVGLQARIEVLGWVLGHDDPDLSDGELRLAKTRRSEFRECLSRQTVAETERGGGQ